jgi:hypothetical protein
MHVPMVIFTVQIWRENRMHDPAMNMASFCMVMVSFRMNVYQRRSKHP